MGIDITRLSAISPLDGRYRGKLEDIPEFFSEYALIRNRYILELRYFYYFVTNILHKKISKETIENCISEFSEKEAGEIKELEKAINHDVKAVEYYIREKLQSLGVSNLQYIHFGLTSEDINSIAYGISIRESKNQIIIPALRNLISYLSKMAKTHASTPMIAKTHGQPAVPTTVGKELIVFALRLQKEYKTLEQLPVEGKITGAVGNYSAHKAGFPHENWIRFCDKVVTSFELTPNHFTTQILPADSYIKIFQSLELINSILIGFSQDMWRYISDGYFVQSIKEQEVGSSTMPQKVNPIDFENTEGNLGLANALFSYFVAKLPISRLQRDLSDSTVKRNFGSAISYSVLGYRSCIQGLKKLSVHKDAVRKDLLNHWEVVVEGIQTIMRVSGDTHAYETVKKFSRGKLITQEDIVTFIKGVSCSPEIKKRLFALTPLTYIGLSESIVENGLEELQKEGFI